MGLSVVISGAIIAVSLIFVLFSMPGIIDSIISVDETSSEVSDFENSILETDISVDSLVGTAGSSFITFNLNNIGSEKLWNYNDFEVFITYDADIGGIKTTTTEQAIFGSTTDFKIQHGTFIIGASLTTDSITEGVDFEKCIGECFIMQSSTRYTGIGRTSGGGNADSDAYTTYVSDDSGLKISGGNIDFTRHNTNSALIGGGVDHDNRIVWQIIEYVGELGGLNEMRVLDTNVCNYPAASLICDGTIISPPSDTNDIVVVITGMGNPDTGTTDSNTGWSTAEWDIANNQPDFRRNEAGGDAVDISYAVVEFTGSNWNVERVVHPGSAAALSTENLLTDVGDVTRAFILQSTTRPASGGNGEGLCEGGQETWISDTDEISYNHPWQQDGWTAVPASFTDHTWVISNSEIATNHRMIVEHQQPTDQRDTTGSEEENWQRPITQLSYTTNETAILGLTTHIDGCGTAIPRGSTGAMLTDDTTVDFWQSDMGQEQDYSFSVVQFPRVIGAKWNITNFQNDLLDPGILNQGEIAQINLKVNNPIFSGGNVAVIISTDNGVTSSNAIITT